MDDSDATKRAKVLNSLKDPAQKNNRDHVDIIIALGMAKEGFDWIWCEHALTIGYRSSLTEIVQIIGRATRDAPGCALLAGMLALKPTETRTLRDNRSLLGFALFAPFAAFLLDQGPLSMALGLASVLGALVALHRLADAEAVSLAGFVPELLQEATARMAAAAQLSVPLVVDSGVGDNWEEAH